MKEKILLVAPFEDLAELAQAVVMEQFADSVHLIRIITGDLHESISQVKEAVAEGVEVVVSRGGTAKLIESQLDIPTVYIQVTITDVLRALKRVGSYPDKIGIAGFENVIYGWEDLAALLGSTFVEIPVHSPEEAKEKIVCAKEQGVKLIIGDAISTKVAGREGLQGILIQSGKEAIFKALNEARIMAKVRREEREKAELLRIVVATSAEGIIATNTNDEITILNPTAEKLLQVSSQALTGFPLKNVIPQFASVKKDQKNGDLQHIGDKTFMVKYHAITVEDEKIGAIYSFQNVTQLQQIEQNLRKRLHKKGLVAYIQMEDMIGGSSVFSELKRKAYKYALTQSTLLITGESGTGKEMMAQGIHNISSRKEGPFVAVNCAALPETLLESELFGYEEGAFTGAKRGGRQGLFELAHGGTLFLDEIGEMPLSLQSRLLRVLQEKAVMRLGGESVCPIDVRIIAATNRHIPDLIEKKEFREDLYYRLNILRLRMPALRERTADIPLLAKQMLQKLKSVNPTIRDIEEAALAYLVSCEWRGNIRQLANTMERAMLLAEGSIISQTDVAEAYKDERDDLAGKQRESSGITGDNLAVLEEDTLLRVLMEENYNVKRTAARLGIHRSTLWRKLKAFEKN
ncbi:MAG: sigma 54-interacting transcriptional regulator [Sporomusaceae bacterium]|nr:sigma 54-interacting transcriptional regulator [Sporomusaceae bacterium]